MKTAMQNLLVEMDNLVRIGLVNEENCRIIRNYVEFIGAKEEEINIKEAWNHAAHTNPIEKQLTAENYFSEKYK
jgi:hypothetical protein